MNNQTNFIHDVLRNHFKGWVMLGVILLLGLAGVTYALSKRGADQPGSERVAQALAAPVLDHSSIAVWAENQLSGGSVVKLASPEMVGREIQLLEFPDAVIIAATVSPSGEWLAVVTENHVEQMLWLASVDGLWPQQVDTGFAISQLTWSRDGKRFYYMAALGDEIPLIGKQGETTPMKVYSERIYSLDVNTYQKRVLASAPADDQVWLLGETLDSSALLFALLGDQDGPHTLHSVSPEGNSRSLPSQLQSWAVMDTLVWPSPDGIRLLRAEGDVMMLDSLDTGESWPVTQLERGFSARWLGESEELVFTKHDRITGVTTLYRVDAASGAHQMLAALEREGDWQIVGANHDLSWIAVYDYIQGLHFIKSHDGEVVPGSQADGGIIFAGWLKDSTLNWIALQDKASGVESNIAPANPVDETSTPTVTLDSTPTLTSTPDETGTPPAATASPSPTPTQASTPTPGDTYLPIVVKPVECPMPYACPIPRHFGYQPSRPVLKPLFIQAAENMLGGNAPTYFRALRGLPPNTEYVTISPAVPIPHLLLRGTAYQESIWVQFLYSWSNPDNQYGCTVLSFDCGYGMMQITSCMSDGCGWFSPHRVSAELLYNLGTGASFLINKWNGIPYYLGENDPTVASDWYYALIGYNGFGSRNDPNNLNCDPRRAPYLEGPIVCSYPYQERVHGWLANPPLMAGQRTWRPTRIAEVPRGIFGLGSSWFPPTFTNRSLTHLLHDLVIVNGEGPELVVHNTTDTTQALDILLYNRNGTFNRRWLDPSNQPPWYLLPHIRLAPGQQRTIDIAEAFPGGTNITIFARVVATVGIDISVNYLNQQAPEPVFEPALSTGNVPHAPEDNAACTNMLANGDFEAFFNGHPAGWNSLSAEGYPLTDSTWFWNGHFGAYLGGYNHAEDILSQDVVLPEQLESIHLSYIWFVRSEEADNAPVIDTLVIDLFDEQGELIVTLPGPTNINQSNNWASANLNLMDHLAEHAGEIVRVSFRAATDAARPTSFFLDEVSLIACSSDG
jgi:hypothetical protein